MVVRAATSVTEQVARMNFADTRSRGEVGARRPDRPRGRQGSTRWKYPALITTV